jgi:SAM-dependent methyltransferase
MAMDSAGDSVLINVGCGDKRIHGYTGIDIVPRSAADIIAPADAIPLPDACADEVLVVHLVEHVYAWQVPDLLGEWARLLKPGGRLVLEMPDVKKCARNLLAGTVGKHADQLHMWGIFGDDRTRDPYMMHRSGWWFARLAPLVKHAGFTAIRELDTQFHSTGRGIRDFRLEAVRA